jgi:hypothetical protein
MLVPQSDKTMVATALAMWFSGQRAVTVYTNNYTGQGNCVINQLDPA